MDCNFQQRKLMRTHDGSTINYSENMSEYKKGKSVSRKEAEKRIRRIFNDKNILVVGQGFDPNFALPLDTFIHERQIDALRSFNWKISQFNAVVNKSGMKDHLHIWVTEIKEWQ